MAVGSGRYVLRSGSGSFAIFAAIRLASSRVSSLAAVRRRGLGLKINVSQRLTVVVADDETTAVVFSISQGGGKRRDVIANHLRFDHANAAMPSNTVADLHLVTTKTFKVCGEVCLLVQTMLEFGRDPSSPTGSRLRDCEDGT